MYRLCQKDFFSNDARVLSRELLGSLLVHRCGTEDLVLRITETEAYMGSADLASHARGGRITPRNRILFGKAGHVYMFLIYGIYWCFNITAGPEDQAQAVLIRAGEAVKGENTMLANRHLAERQLTLQKQLQEIASGPGKLCQALNLDGALNGLDLTDPANETLYIARDELSEEPGPIGESVRIGIEYAGKDKDRLWRYYLTDSDSVSRSKQRKE